MKIELDESYFEDGFYDWEGNGPYKYHVSSYFDGNYRGLEDDFYSNDKSSVEDWIWDHASKGGFIELEGSDGSVNYTPDELEERVEAGDSIVTRYEWGTVEKIWDVQVDEDADGKEHGTYD